MRRGRAGGQSRVCGGERVSRGPGGAADGADLLLGGRRLADRYVRAVKGVQRKGKSGAKLGSSKSSFCLCIGQIPMPGNDFLPIAYARSAPFAGSFVMVGGYSDGLYLDTVYLYDPDQDNFILLDSKLESRKEASVELVYYPIQPQLSLYIRMSLRSWSRGQCFRSALEMFCHDVEWIVKETKSPTEGIFVVLLRLAKKVFMHFALSEVVTNCPSNS